MSEKKEKQYAVLKYSPSGTLLSIVWFDAREQARGYATTKNCNTRIRARYRVMPMTRGPHA